MWSLGLSFEQLPPPPFPDIMLINRGYLFPGLLVALIAQHDLPAIQFLIGGIACLIAATRHHPQAVETAPVGGAVWGTPKGVPKRHRLNPWPTRSCQHTLPIMRLVDPGLS